MSAQSSTDDPKPVLRIVRGNPTPEELAVLTALAAAGGGSGGSAPERRERRGGWNDPSAMHRRPVLAGPNGWRAAVR